MVRKYPSLNRNNGYGRIKFYIENPPENIEPDDEEHYKEVYEDTVGYLKDLNDELIDDLIYLYTDIEDISELLYGMYGFSQLTHYIVHNFNLERMDYYQRNNLKLPDLGNLF
jgi:hypothetical protein